MLKSCGLLFGLVQVSKRDSNSYPGKEFSGERTASLDVSLHFSGYSSLSLQLKDVSVRIIHAGGQEELYQCPVPVAQIMEKYPGIRVARPEVFRNPHESILRDNDKLLAGHKYFIIPSTTAKKLKQWHEAKRKGEGHRKENKQVRQKGRLP